MAVFSRLRTGLYPQLLSWLDANEEPQMASLSARLPVSASIYAYQSSSANSTTTPLLSGATYTGTGESNDLPEVAVSVYSSTAGTLYLQYKNPGSALWHTIPASGYPVAASTHIMANGLKHARDFRAKFVNAGGDQASFELFSYFGAGFILDSLTLRPANGATAAVASTTSPVTILAANPNRLGASITHDDANALYLLLGAGTVSASLYTIKLITGSEPYETPYGFTGLVTGIWAADGAGSAYATELTF